MRSVSLNPNYVLKKVVPLRAIRLWLLLGSERLRLLETNYSKANTLGTS